MILAESETDLKIFLDCTSAWCLNSMSLNGEKQIVHFRTPSIPKSNCCFNYGGVVLDCVDKYTYLGILLNEKLDCNVTANAVAVWKKEVLLPKVRL